MPFTLTNDADQVTQALCDFLEANTSLGLKAVYYGDQSRIGATPAVCVETGNTEQDLIGTGYYVSVVFNVAIMVYFSKVASESELKREGNQFANRVMDVLHSEPLKNLDGLIIHGHVVRVEPGTAIRSGARLRAHRLTWRGISRANL